MGKREEPEAPRDLTPADQKRLVMVAYWRRLRRGEPNIGYGMAKGYLWLQLAVVAHLLARYAFTLFIEPKLLPRVRYLVRNAPSFAATFVLSRATSRMRRSSGYYQLDNGGAPVRFLSKQLPPSIQGRLGTSRRAYLRRG